MHNWCETCDRGFPSLRFLENHKREHQKCKIDGCQFVAHPNVITKHIQMQHASGLFSRIANLNRPEDIQKWIEERKKKYPTKLNIEKKIASIKEKINRGEKLGLGYNKKEKKIKQGIDRKYPFEKTNRNNCSNNNISKNVTRNKHKKKELKLPTVKNKHGLKPFTGLKYIIEDSDINQSDNEELPDIEFDDEANDNVGKHNIENEKKIQKCCALSALSTNYGSSDEDDNFYPPNESKLLQNKESVISSETVEKINDLKPNCKDDIIAEEKSDDDRPEEVKIVKNNVIDESCVSSTKKHPQTVKKNNTVQSQKRFNSINKSQRNTKSKLPSTLLQKLLQNEIRQERNIVLQCIRYIKRNNYLEKDKNI